MVRLSDMSLPHRIWVDGDRLLYDWDFDTKPVRQRRVNFDGVLEAFRKITEPTAVLKFALRYGPLGICEHDKPYTHNRVIHDGAVDDRAAGCHPRGWGELPAWDPIDVWLAHAERARELLRIAADLHLGKVDGTDWAGIFGAPPDPQSDRQWEKVFNERITPSRRLKDARLGLSLCVNEWLATGSVSPSFSWHASQPEMSLAGGTFGMVAVQLAAAVAQAPSFARCDGCKKAYFRKGRKPQTGRRNFCPECGRTVANRLGQRDHQARIRGTV